MRTWQRILMMVAAGIAAFVIMVPEADARRLGGGRSFGKQSNIVPKRADQAPAAGQSARQQPGNAAAAGQQRNRWLGPIGGLAAGLGLAWLASSLGLSEEFGTIILIGLLLALGLMLYRRFAASARPRPALQGAGGPALRDSLRPQPMAAPGGAVARPADVAAGPAGVPADFDVDGFVHQAKVQFIRLQAVFDAADLGDLREFTTPEVFAELKLQIEQGAGAPQRTDVVQLDAELLGIETTPTEYLAGVRYSGMLREQPDEPAAPFSEVWTLSKPLAGQGGWVLAGIQQAG